MIVSQSLAEIFPLQMMQVGRDNFVTIVNYVSLDGWQTLEAGVIESINTHM